MKLITLFLSMTFYTSVYADFYDGLIKYFDNLKVCKPHEFKYVHPMVKDFNGKNTIKGLENNKCHVVINMPKNMKMKCLFSLRCVGLITSKEAYLNAQSRKMPKASPPEVSKCSTNECEILK